jgi:hypothetical protein
MKRFLLLYSGPPTPPDASHKGWSAWFRGLGDALVDRGSRMVDGVVVRGDGATSEPPATLTGYGIIEAEDRDAAVDLVRDHPILQVRGYAIELFEVPSR